jgi:hypothetical protein
VVVVVSPATYILWTVIGLVLALPILALMAFRNRSRIDWRERSRLERRIRERQRTAFPVWQRLIVASTILSPIIVLALYAHYAS